jgi:outer membrane protein
MRKKGLVKVLGVLLASLLVVSAASVVFAQEEPLKRFGVKMSAMFVYPADSFDSKLDGLGLSVANAVAPKLELEYFFTKNFSTELVLAFTKNDVDSDGPVSGSLWLLPPSLFAKYHPIPSYWVSPYVGFGFNVVFPFSEKLYLNGSRVDFDVDNSVGWAVKFGFDVPIVKTQCVNVVWNVDTMYYSTKTKMSVAGSDKLDLNINPWLISTGIGLRF